MPLERKEFVTEVKEFNDAEMTIDHFISTEMQDAVGDIMLAEGVKLYGTPAVLVQHGLDPKFGKEPVAKPISITPGTKADGTRGLIARTKFYDGSNLNPPDNTGRRLYEKCRDGYFSKWSIGFNSTKERPTTGGRVVEEWDLMEYSLVAVPCNSGCTTLSTEPVELKFIVEKPTAQKTVNVPEIKSSHRRADKVLGMMHDLLLSDLKEFAASDSFPVDGAEKCANKALDEFVEDSLPAVKSYIKAVQDMDGNEEFDPDTDDNEDEREEKGYHKCRGNLKKCYKALIGNIRSFKCKKEINPDDEAPKCIGTYRESATVHAVEFVKEYAAKLALERVKVFGGVEIKSVAANAAYSIIRGGIETINNAAWSEVYDRSYKDKEVAAEEIADAVLAECVLLLRPYFIALCNYIRDPASGILPGLSVKEFQATLEKKYAESKPDGSAEKTPVIRFVKHPAKGRVIRMKATPKPSIPVVRFKAQPVEPKVKITTDDLKALVSDLTKSASEAARKEIRRLAGKVD